MGAMGTDRHRQTFPARRDALPRVDAFLSEVCAAAGLERDVCLRLTLLVEELFTNTVVHGHGHDSEAPVWLEFEVASGGVALTYEDTAPRTIPSRRWSPPTRPRRSRIARWAGSACC